MKENKIEKLVLDLSNRWDCSPEEAVDRLNSMNESEINKLINSMTNKFAKGGLIDCLRAGNKIADCGCGKKVGVEKGALGMEIDGDSTWKTEVKAPGDTLYTKQYFSGPATRHVTPKGIRYERINGAHTWRGVSPDYKAGPLESIANWLLGVQTVGDNHSEKKNWDKLLQNHKNDPITKDKTVKKACGGPLPKKKKNRLKK